MRGLAVRRSVVSAAVAGVSVLALAGCGGETSCDAAVAAALAAASSSATPTPTTTWQPPVTRSATLPPVTTVPPPIVTTMQTTIAFSMADQILDSLLAHPDLASLPLARKVELARSVCADFDSGVDVESIRSGLMVQGFPRSASSEVIRVAAANYCPDYGPEAFGYGGN